MKRPIPQQAWAVLIATLGVSVAIVGYLFPGDVASKQSMFTVANSLISGALGAFAAHAANSSTATGPDATIINKEV